MADTWEQLCHCEDQDAGEDLRNPCFTPLASWEEQVKAAIVAARQEAAEDTARTHPAPPPRAAHPHLRGGTRWGDLTRAKARDQVGGGLATLPSSRAAPSPRGRTMLGTQPPSVQPPLGDMLGGSIRAGSRILFWGGANYAPLP